jgi:dTDP-4-amino-4,6-dideoxygalactose transaminase
MVKFLDLHHQYLSIKSEIDKAIADTISNTSFIGGSAVTEFEHAFAAYQQAAHCVGVANGTDALEIAIEALALPIGSEIIVPANSFISSSEAVTRSGHRVVFADIDPGTYLINPSDVKRHLGPNTRAIIAVHLYGQPCDMDSLRELANAHNLAIIEDCAQAHGAEYKGRRVGTLGDVSTFSFYPGKNLGAYGDAGAIVTNDTHLALRCRMIANHGRVEKYNHIMEGRNSRLDGLQAAILSVKLRHLDKWIERRNEIAQMYLNGLAGLPKTHLPFVQTNVRHSFHLFVIRTPYRAELIKHLTEHGIETGIHYPIALPKLKAYEYLGQRDDCPNACTMDDQVLSIPMGEHLQPEHAEAVVMYIKQFNEQLLSLK